MENDHMQFIYEIVMEQSENMKTGEIRDCEGLIGPDAWDSVPPPEHRYVFGRPISILVAQGKVSLEFAGFNRARHNLYRKK